MDNNIYSDFILSGGGVKGVAFIGAFEAAKLKGYIVRNTGGVSAGAMVSALAGAGYSTAEMKKLLSGFKFDRLTDDGIAARIPAVKRFQQLRLRRGYLGSSEIRYLVTGPLMPDGKKTRYGDNVPEDGEKRDFWSNLKKLVTEGWIYNGDYIEEWMEKALHAVGVRTFADLKGGAKDDCNPNGYRVRMTAVDINRAKAIILPDELGYYGISPDSFSVAKAVRMSSSIPLVFKAVEIKYRNQGEDKTAHIVDGGVLSNFPAWIFSGKNKTCQLTGFKFSDRKKILSLDTPFNILKAIVSSLHDTGVSDHNNVDKLVEIDASEVSFLDFEPSEKEIEYLYNSGYTSCMGSLK